MLQEYLDQCIRTEILRYAAASTLDPKYVAKLIGEWGYAPVKEIEPGKHNKKGKGDHEKYKRRDGGEGTISIDMSTGMQPSDVKTHLSTAWSNPSVGVSPPPNGEFAKFVDLKGPYAKHAAVIEWHKFAAQQSKENQVDVLRENRARFWMEEHDRRRNNGHHIRALERARELIKDDVEFDSFCQAARDEDHGTFTFEPDADIMAYKDYWSLE